MANESQVIINKALQFFSSISDKTRLSILLCLTEGNKTVTEIYNLVGKNMTLSAISHQLKLLNNLGIIQNEKRGRQKYYKLSDDFCWCILNESFNHFKGKCKCSKTKHLGVK